MLLVTASQATCWTQAPAPAGPVEPGGEKTSDLIEVLQKYGLNEPISASSSPRQPQESQKRNEAAWDLGPTALSQQGTVPSLTACLGDRAVGSLAPSCSREMGQAGRERSDIPQTPLLRLRAFVHKRHRTSRKPPPHRTHGFRPFLKTPPSSLCLVWSAFQGTCAM